MLLSSGLYYFVVLLVSDCFLCVLAGAGVVLCALTTYGETTYDDGFTVATDVHQSLDVQLKFAAQVTFNLVILPG